MEFRGTKKFRKSEVGIPRPKNFSEVGSRNSEAQKFFGSRKSEFRAIPAIYNKKRGATFEALTFEDPTFEDPTFEDPTFEDPTFEDPTFEDLTFEDPTFADIPDI
ncbi:hypothetical protein niasHT_020598 [Heterodera trifolii]|uniref:Uncharacterized protein n=1 Tax=Heterodera trifolii TaxID=157864 RepID=A0ABD2K5X5_9BILA